MVATDSPDANAAAADDDSVMPDGTLLRRMREMLPNSTGRPSCSHCQPFTDPNTQLYFVDLLCAPQSSQGCSVPADTATGEDAAADPVSTECDSDLDGEHPLDTPQQRAAALVWDASYSEASCGVMVQHGLLDVCAALLRHSQTIGDGTRKTAHPLNAACHARAFMKLRFMRTPLKWCLPCLLHPTQRIRQTGSEGNSLVVTV
jgi:hypothetical protein